MSDAIRAAVAAGDIEALRVALRAQPEAATAPQREGGSALLQAVYRGQPALAALLIEAGWPADACEAAALGDTGRLAALLASPREASLASWSGDGWTPLHLAVFFGHLGAAALLVDAGADLAAVSRNGLAVTPLQSALAQRARECAVLLLEHGADPNGDPAEGWPPLAYCAANDMPGVAELLLLRGADSSRTTPDGQTPLAMAEARGHTAVVRILRGERAC